MDRQGRLITAIEADVRHPPQHEIDKAKASAAPTGRGRTRQFADMANSARSTSDDEDSRAPLVERSRRGCAVVRPAPTEHTCEADRREWEGVRCGPPRASPGSSSTLATILW